MTTPARPTARRGPSGAWNRLKAPAVDALDVYGLPSKGETRLNDPQAQETYYAKIVERYMRFCASSSDASDLTTAFNTLSLQNHPPTSNPVPIPTPSPALATIHLAMRKLRESLLATRRIDPFAQRAYIFIIHASLLTQTWESYHPALLYLLYTIHPHTPLSPSELIEHVGYHMLDLSCRQNLLGRALSVGRQFGVVLQHGEAGASARLVRQVLQALMRDDWVRFWRLRRSVDGYMRALMGFAAPRVRRHALKCLGRSYFSVERAFVERACAAEWADLVKEGCGWELEGEEGRRVVIRRVKAKGAGGGG